MSFLRLPIEIRVQIYSEVLVRSEPLDFSWVLSPILPSQRYGLTPTILYLNKQVHSEASPLLYTNNVFQFLNIVTLNSFLHFFLRPFGSNVALLHHICINFPLFRNSRKSDIEARDQDLNLIQTCTGLMTLELSLRPNHPLRGKDRILPQYEANVVETFRLLDSHLRVIISLKRIIVTVQMPHDQGEGGKFYDDELIKKMRKYGWIIIIEKVAKPTGRW